jgi:hypothetical protein
MVPAPRRRAAAPATCLCASSYLKHHQDTERGRAYLKELDAISFEYQVFDAGGPSLH